MNTAKDSQNTEDLPKIFGEKDIIYYWNVIKIPVLFCIFVGSLFLLDDRGWGFVYGVFTLGLMYSVYMLHTRGSRQKSEYVFLGILFGFLFGFCVYVVNFVSQLTVSSFFAIIYSTFLVVIVGGLLSFGLSFFARFLKV